MLLGRKVLVTSSINERHLRFTTLRSENDVEIQCEFETSSSKSRVTREDFSFLEK